MITGHSVSTSMSEITEKKRKQLEDAHNSITQAYRKVINADMPAPYYYIEHPQTKQQLWFTLGVPYHWEKEGARFKIENKEMVYDLAMQAGGEVVFVEKEGSENEPHTTNP